MKPIKITAQEQPDGTIKVLNIDNCLPVEELPCEYLQMYPHCIYKTFPNSITIGITIFMHKPMYNDAVIDSSAFLDFNVNVCYIKENFNYVITLLKQCGDNLSECRKQKEPFVVEI